MLSPQAARNTIIDAFKEVFNRAPNLYEAQFAQSVALYESGYGSYRFYNHVTDSYITETNNWGSVHCQVTPPCPPDCFEATDTHADGTKYLACFKRFTSPEEGAKFFIRTFYKNKPSILAAANSGSISNVAQAIHSSRYSEASPAKLESSLTIRLQEITKALGEPMPSSGGSIRWRLILGISVIGIAGYYLWPLISKDTESEPA